MAGPFRRTRHTLAYLAAKLFLTFVQFVPRPIMLRLSACIGLILGFILIPYRRQILQNLDEVYGDRKSRSEKQKITNKLFCHLGLTLCDAIKVPSLSRSRFHEIVKADVSAVKRVLEEQKSGAVVVGGHLSCFELQSHLFGAAGLPIMAIGAPLFDKRIDAEVDKLRSRNGVLYLHRDGVGRRLLKELKSNSIFISLIDQDATNDGVFANFLGKEAFTPTGPIRIAQKYSVPLFFFTLERKSDYSYEFKISGPVESPCTGDDQKDLVITAQKFNDFIGAQIEKCPEQWVWMHRRWNRKRADHPAIPSITDYEANL